MSQMPGLLQNSFEASSVRRLSALTSVLVKALAWSAVKKFAPLNGPAAGPQPPIAHRFASEMPVPFGKLTPVKLFQVNRTADMKVKGSEISSSSLGIHWKSRSPLKQQGTKVNGPGPIAGPP